MPHQIWVFKHIRTEILGLTLLREGHDWRSRNSSRGFQITSSCHLCVFFQLQCNVDSTTWTWHISRPFVDGQWSLKHVHSVRMGRWTKGMVNISVLSSISAKVLPLLNHSQLRALLEALRTNVTLRCTCICSRTPSVEEKVNWKKWPYLIPRWRKSLAWLANWKSWPGRVRRGSSGRAQTSHLSQSSHQPPQSSRKLKRKPGKGEKNYYLTRDLPGKCSGNL